ncbi:MAG TPA: lytic transglycosylase domain-containing protein, partial [Kiloniellales bacterium]|nr:lytic transglycosylase domain-containing protein [Kiloniellales bacterium]
ALQEAGKWPEADARIARLSDERLLGHLQAQRYLHPTAYRSRYAELQHWLSHYADHPQARRIYRLALKRRPKGAAAPRRPVEPSRPYAGLGAVASEPARSGKALSRAERREANRLKRQVRRNVLRTRLTITEDLLERPRTRELLDRVERDEAYSEVAAAWFYSGRDDKAYALADGAARRSGAEVPLAHWIAGLAAWRQNRLPEAAGHFERLAESPRASGWNVAAGAYWAARACLRLRAPAETSRWLRIAAEHPHTFYGVLARRALGLRPHLEPASAELAPELIARLEAVPAGARALALLQVGQRELAETELARIAGDLRPETAAGLLALAERARLPALAFRLAQRLAGLGTAGPEGSLDRGLIEAALYPIPPWRPRGGFQIDRALLFAMMRQESGFNPAAKSPDGARGLMQLMPSTAGYIARDRAFRWSKRWKLFEPETNLELGQRYIAHLLDQSAVGGDLFRLAAAYNGGPGNLNKWQRRMNFHDDPLLFIESLPSRETRLFIERVLTNLWIYRARLGQPAPSLDGIAAGDWPLYVSQDDDTAELASHEPN